MILSVREQTGAGVRRICSVLGLPRSSYYLAATPTATAVEDQRIGDEIERIFHEHLRRYGYRRIREELRDLEVRCGPVRVRRIMNQRGLSAIQPKNFVPRTSDGRADLPSSNLLIERKEPTRMDEIWTGDITFIPTSEGWRYLAIVIDLYSRRVVGWSLADNLRSNLVCDAMTNALENRPIRKDTIFHSDRGSQYGSKMFREILKRSGITQSMSRRANPYDNAWTESFMGTLKSEMVQGRCFVNQGEARKEIFTYIDGYYNTRRKHSAIGYVAPATFESNHHLN